VGVVDSLVRRVVDPTSLKRGGKIVRGWSYMSSMYAGVGNGDGLWDGMIREWQSHDKCRGSCLLALGGRASVSME